MIASLRESSLVLHLDRPRIIDGAGPSVETPAAEYTEQEMRCRMEPQLEARRATDKRKTPAPVPRSGGPWHAMIWPFVGGAST
jgi:hypothetical protein